MPYPKPLSEKSIEKMYKEAGISGAKRDYLQKVFAAAANLYGAIDLRNLWKVLKELEKKSDCPKLKRKELIDFSAIARREEHDYRVYEIDELYLAEERNEMDRFVVSKQLVRAGYGQLVSFYELMDAADKPYYIPGNFTDYSEHKMCEEEENLFRFLCKLKSTSDECEPIYGESIPNENKGKTLKEFSFVNWMERFDMEYYIKKPAILRELAEKTSVSEAEKIMREYRFEENVGYLNFIDILQNMTAEIGEAGVMLSEKQLKELINLVNDCHNNCQLWQLNGWSPKGLSQEYGSGQPATITFGPGLEKAIKEGTIDKDELVKGIREKGFSVEE